MAVQPDQIYTVITWVWLLGAPFLAIPLLSFWEAHWRTRWGIIGVNLATCALVIWFSRSGWSFKAHEVNILIKLIAYLAFCLLIVSAWRIKQTALRIILRVLTSIPIVAIYLFGLLGLIGDIDENKYSIEQMGPNFSCEKTDWLTYSEFGTTTSLYRSWAFIPYLERNVKTIAVNETSGRDKGVTCQEILRQYEAEAR